MNILILSCGTRNRLVRFFKESAEVDKVIVTDCSEQAPALFEADKYYIIPRMKEPGYFDKILEICKNEHIDFVLPLQEDELILTAKNLDKYLEAGVRPVISDLEKVLLCKDKYALNNWLIENGIPAVRTILAKDYLDSGMDFDTVFVKPRDGAGSVNTFAVHTKGLIKALVEDSKEELIVQPLMRGKEYGVDTYVDLISGQVVTSFVKEKLRMRAGETEKSISIINKDIEALAVNTINALGLRGPVDMDIMEDNGKYYVLEINPRFGGGYPHAHACGVRFTDFLSKNAKGIANEVNRNNYPENVLVMKYSEIMVR